MASYPDGSGNTVAGGDHQQEVSSLLEHQQQQQSAKQHPYLSAADEEFLNPATCLFHSVVKQEYSTLLQLYAHNARNAIVSYLAMKNHHGGIGGLGAPGGVDGGMFGANASGFSAYKSGASFVLQSMFVAFVTLAVLFLLGAVFDYISTNIQIFLFFFPPVLFLDPSIRFHIDLQNNEIPHKRQRASSPCSFTGMHLTLQRRNWTNSYNNCHTRILHHLRHRLV